MKMILILSSPRFSFDFFLPLLVFLFLIFFSLDKIYYQHNEVSIELKRHNCYLQTSQLEMEEKVISKQLLCEKELKNAKEHITFALKTATNRIFVNKNHPKTAKR